MDSNNKQTLLFKSIFDQSIADIISIIEEPSYKATFSKLSDFLRIVLETLFDLSNYDEHIQRAFEIPRLVQNSLNNLRIALKDCRLNVKQIFNLDGRRYKQLDEGFKSENDVSSIGDSDIHSEDQASKPVLKKQVYAPPEINVADLLHLLDQRKVLIEDLKQRVTARDQTIKEMTIGYLKDIAHLREMYSRKEEHPEEEVFEVSYYDVKQGMDPEIRDYIERQIKQAVNTANLRIKDLEFRLKALQSEIEQLNRTITLLLAKQDLTQIIKVAFTMEKDKYKFWRVLQDQVGNEFIFDIFEKQKGGYGIDYRQIDDLIQQSQASFRVYQRQREVMEDQILELVSRAGAYVSTLQKENDMKDQKILSLKDQLEYEIIQAQRDTKLLMEQQFKEREAFLQRQYQMSRMQQLRDWVNVDHQKMIHRNMSRYAILKWSLYAKFLKMVPLFQRFRESKSKELSLTRLDYYGFSEVRDHLMKELIKGQTLREEVQEDMVQYLQDQVKELQQELNFQQEQICEVTIERDSLKKHNKQLTFRTVQNKHDRLMMQERIFCMQQTIDTMENNFKLYDRTFQAVLSSLGFKHDQYVGLKNLSKIVYHSGGPDLQTFVNRLSNLNIDDVGNLRALNNIYLKAQLAYNRIIIKPDYRETGTITNIFDLNHPLTWLENINNTKSDEMVPKTIAEPERIQLQSSVDSSIGSEEENDRFEKSPAKQIILLKQPPMKRASQHKQSISPITKPILRNDSPRRNSIFTKKVIKQLSPLQSETASNAVLQQNTLTGIAQRVPSTIKVDINSLTQSLIINQSNNGNNVASSSSDMNQSHIEKGQLSQLSQTSHARNKKSQKIMSISVDRQIQTYRSIEDQSTQTIVGKKLSQEIRLKQIDSRFKRRTHNSLHNNNASPVPIIENSSRIHRTIQNKFQVSNERLASFIARQNIVNFKGLNKSNYVQGSQLVTMLKDKGQGDAVTSKRQESISYDVDYFKNIYVEHQKSSVQSPRDGVEVVRYRPSRQSPPNMMPFDTLIPSFIQEIQ